MTTQTYSTAEFAKLIGVSRSTLQNWDKRGVLKARRTITKRWYYTDEDASRAMSPPKD